MIKEETYVVPEGYGSDTGKRFVVTQMSSVRAEKWAIRMLNLLMTSGVQISDGAIKGGLATLSVQDLSFATFQGLNWALLEPLLDEMLDCVRFDPTGRGDMLRPIRGGTDEVDEVKTLFWLRGKVVELHTGFSLADRLKSLSASGTKKSPPTRSRTSRG